MRFLVLVNFSLGVRNVLQIVMVNILISNTVADLKYADMDIAS